MHASARGAGGRRLAGFLVQTVGRWLGLFALQALVRHRHGGGIEDVGFLPRASSGARVALCVECVAITSPEVGGGGAGSASVGSSQTHSTPRASERPALVRIACRPNRSNRRGRGRGAVSQTAGLTTGMSKTCRRAGRRRGVGLRRRRGLGGSCMRKRCGGGAGGFRVSEAGSGMAGRTVGVGPARVVGVGPARMVGVGPARMVGLWPCKRSNILTDALLDCHWWCQSGWCGGGRAGGAGGAGGGGGGGKVYCASMRVGGLIDSRAGAGGGRPRGGGWAVVRAGRRSGRCGTRQGRSDRTQHLVGVRLRGELPFCLFGHPEGELCGAGGIQRDGDVIHVGMGGLRMTSHRTVENSRGYDDNPGDTPRSYIS